MDFLKCFEFSLLLRQILFDYIKKLTRNHGCRIISDPTSTAIWEQLEELRSFMFQL